MKRGVYVNILVILLFLTIIPVSLAEIYIDPLEKINYNVGDKINIKGFIKSDLTQSGNFKVVLNCDGKETQLINRFLNLEQDETYPFQEQLPIPLQTSGSCIILTNYNQDSLKTSRFDIAKDLKGTFNVNPTELQLGDKLTINGDIKKLDGTKINGFGTLFIKKDSETILSSQVTLLNSQFTYSSEITSIPAGDYSIELELTDEFGNKHYFKLASLKVSNKLEISYSLDKDQYNPGESMIIKGNILRSINNDKKIDGKITLTIDNYAYNAEFKNGRFEYNLLLSKTLKSKSHTLFLEAKDTAGNIGSKQSSFFIIPTSTILKIETSKETYNPSDQVEAIISLADQANDVMSKEIKLTIINPNNKKVYEKQQLSIETFTYDLDQYPIPGQWTISASINDIETTKTFSVPLIKQLSFNLKGALLEIKNIGNVRYNDPIQIEYSGADSKIIERRTNLDPGQSIILGLNKDVYPGTYDITIINQNKKFEKVNLQDTRSFGTKITDALKEATGAVVLNPGSTTSKTPIAYLSLLILLMVFTIFIVRVRRVSRVQRERQKDFQEGQKFKETVKSSPTYKKPSYGTPTERDVQDLRDKIQRDFSNPTKFEYRAPKSRQSFDQPLQKNSNKEAVEAEHSNNPFRMFD